MADNSGEGSPKGIGATGNDGRPIDGSNAALSPVQEITGQDEANPNPEVAVEVRRSSRKRKHAKHYRDEQAEGQAAEYKRSTARAQAKRDSEVVPLLPSPAVNTGGMPLPGSSEVGSMPSSGADGIEEEEDDDDDVAEKKKKKNSEGESSAPNSSEDIEAPLPDARNEGGNSNVSPGASSDSMGEGGTNKYLTEATPELVAKIKKEAEDGKRADKRKKPGETSGPGNFSLPESDEGGRSKRRRR